MLAMMRPVMPILEYYANYDYVTTLLRKTEISQLWLVMVNVIYKNKWLK